MIELLRSAIAVRLLGVSVPHNGLQNGTCTAVVQAPVIVQGILGYGVYTYSSVADGTVSIALKNNWNQSYPQTWNVAYADETITAKGVDGQMLTLERADDVTLAVLNTLVEQNGNWLSSHTGSVGIIYMDFAGMDKSPSYSAESLYETCGMTLVDLVIKQNRK